MMARYLIELSLIEYGLIKYNPSHLAAAAIYLAGKIFKVQNIWNDKIAESSQYSEGEIRSCAKKLCELISNKKKSV